MDNNKIYMIARFFLVIIDTVPSLTHCGQDSEILNSNNSEFLETMKVKDGAIHQKRTLLAILSFCGDRHPNVVVTPYSIWAKTIRSLPLMS